MSNATMTNDLIKRIAEFDSNKSVEVTIIFDTHEDDPPIKVENIQNTVYTPDICTESTSKIHQEANNTIESDGEIIHTSTTENINCQSNELNNNIIESSKDLPILVRDDEIYSSVSTKKIETKRKISLPYSENDFSSIKRIHLAKEQGTTIKTSTDVTGVINTLNISAGTQNAPPSKTNSDKTKETVKFMAEDLLRVYDMLIKYGFDIVNDVCKLDFHNFISAPMITAIETIIMPVPVHKHDEFLLKLVDLALYLCHHKYSHNSLLQLLKEILKWVKSRKSNKSDTVRKVSTDTLPDVVMSKTTSNTNSTCLYSNGPPGREINISVDATLLRQITQNSTCTSTSVKNSKAPVTSEKCNTNTQSKTMTSNTSKKDSRPDGFIKRSPLHRDSIKTNVETKSLNKDSVLKGMLNRSIPGPNINQSQRSYCHPLYESNTMEYREPQNINTPTQNLAITQPTLNHQQPRPNHIAQVMPQNSFQSQPLSNLTNFCQKNVQPHSYMAPSQTPAMTQLSAKIQLQLRETRQVFTSQTRRPPPWWYHKIQDSRQPNLPQQVPQSQQIHYPSMPCPRDFQGSMSYMAPQAQQNSNNLLYPSSNYPVSGHGYSSAPQQSGPASSSISYWLKNVNTNIRQANNKMHPTQMFPNQVHNLPHPGPRDNGIGLRESTRSTSTDSGFISPLNFNTSSEPTSNGPDEMNPIITHVTSLNPAAVYIEEGPCYVCSTLTKKMCTGCLNYYYCSMECQQKDWQFHQYICKGITIE